MLVPQYVLFLLFPYLTLTQPIPPVEKSLANTNGTQAQTPPTPHLPHGAPILLPRGNAPSKPFKSLEKKIKKLLKWEGKDKKDRKSKSKKKDKKKDKKKKDKKDKGKGKESGTPTIFAPGPDGGWWELKLDGPKPGMTMALPTILGAEYHKNSMSPLSPVDSWSPPRPPIVPPDQPKKQHAKKD
ncbi:hypothetical protein HOY82DRAFT_617475 [Tuber indicum]|nr:hypothetical protein HOY82DRAFT_617475 [Tuber indicum]